MLYTIRTKPNFDGVLLVDNRILGQGRKEVLHKEKKIISYLDTLFREVCMISPGMHAVIC